MKRFTASVAASLVLALGLATAQAQQTLYWDVNGTEAGATPGGNGIGDGVWDITAANWNTDPTGGAAGALSAWSDNNDAVFAAGSDLGTDPTFAGVFFSAGSAGTKALHSLTIEEGWVDLTGVILAMGANPITIKQGATLSIPNQANITATADQTLTLDGGTIRNYVLGVGSTFYTAGVATKWQITANGGTVSTPNGGSTDGKTGDPVNGGYSIMAYGSATLASTIGLDPGTTTGTMRKTGHGEFRPFNSTNITGWDVQSGFLRVPGGATDSAFGAANGTVTVAGGAVENSSNGAAVGTTANLTADAGAAGPSPATRSFVLSGIGDTADSMLVTNANWQILGNISGPGGLMLNGWSRNDGSFGSDLANALGTQNELRLGGHNTYGGKTTVNFGTIVAQGGSAIPDSSAVVISTRSDWGVDSAPAANHKTFNTAVLRVDATETVGSLSGGNATRGQVTLNGTAVTLTTGADNTSTTFSGTITGAGGLVKTGSGTFTMDGVKSYTGDTTVHGTGTLSTNSASFADTADVYLNAGSFLNLNFTAGSPDIIDSLFIDGVSQAIGTWGGTGSGAAHISSLITGTGLLQVSTTASAGVPGDYNGNGVVDSADYVVWRNGGPLQNEVPGVTPGLVTPEDYAAWKARFGNTSGSGSSLAGGAAVPEPCGLVLLLAGAAAIIARRHRL